MSEAKVFRYAVPVDDQWHTLKLAGPVLFVASRQPDVVEVWALHSGKLAVDRHFRAFGTGHSLPTDRIRYVGTALAAGGALVWHLFERNGEPTGARVGTS